jgi:hypothetical protein
MHYGFVEEMLRGVKNFTDDMEKMGVKVVDVHSEGATLRIRLDLQPKPDEHTEGGDEDENRADTRR